MTIPRLARILVATIALAAPVLTVLAAPAAWAQARSMDLGYSGDELTGADQNLRQLQQDQPLLFQQILNDINTGAKARDPASAEDLAAASPALEDLNRSSPEALLGLFLLLKGAAKGDGKGAR